MSYKIVIDSCGDMPQNLRQDEHFTIVPLTLIVEGIDIVDDDTFDQKDFLKRVAASKECPKSACPSPQRYMDEFKQDNTDVYVVTLSAELSGSYNSAKVGRDMYIEEGGRNNVHIFNSMSASGGETLVGLKVKEYVEQGLEFKEIVDRVETYIENMRTYFVIETLDTLRKNGRLTNLQAIIASALNIKPVMSADHGKIIKLEQTRGMNKALSKMVDVIKNRTADAENKIMTIAHCNNYERALFVKEKIQSVMKVKDIIILDTYGVSSMYANEGGIIVSI